MIYQVYYNNKSLAAINTSNEIIKACGVYHARKINRIDTHIYDDEKVPNLTDHNTLCEWRILYYIWNHYKTPWVGFTSWQHDKKKFKPNTDKINKELCENVLKHNNIAGLCILPLKSLIFPTIANKLGINLKSQFLQFSLTEKISGYKLCDIRNSPLGKYHCAKYWDFVINEFDSLYGTKLEKELDFEKLSKIDALHTWCNAFIANWEYFDEYMRIFSPIVFEMLKKFGSHPKDLELSYICERLIILHNYIKYSNKEFYPNKSTPVFSREIEEQETSLLRHRDSSAEITFITCSVDDRKFQKFKENIIEKFGINTQIVRIHNARSLAEGYNRGIIQACGEIIVFCHDDIEILNDNVAEIIRDDLKIYDIIGVAGTSKLNDGKWISSGQPYIHGQVIHKKRNNPNGYTLCIYGLGRDDTIIEDIQALDGLFFAANRNVLKEIQFDDKLFDGFHLYDLDFCFNAYQKGLRLAVDQRILMLHASAGNFDICWERYAERFEAKYSKVLCKSHMNNTSIIRGIYAQDKNVLKNEMIKSIDTGRLFMETGSLDHPEFFYLINDGKKVITTKRERKKGFIELNDHSVNFSSLLCKNQLQFDMERFFTEIFRISRHGAIIELKRGDNKNYALNKDARECSNRLKYISNIMNTISLIQNNKNVGGFKLLGSVNEGTIAEAAYFQVDKVGTA